ncbi:MAG: replicative DNA helicase [Clostridia bacterium]|nr:replicative DNA helicase [Clostridia bacterium]
MAGKGIGQNGINPDHPNLKARILPHNNEAEQAVLGCVLLDADAPIHILTVLTPADFYSKAHGNIFDAMVRISRRDEPVDVVTLTQELDTMGLLESVGGLTYLADLSNCVPGAANYKHYVGLVRKLSNLRKLIGAAQKITDVAFVGDPDDDALGFAEREIYALSEENDRSALREIQPSVVEAIAKMETMYRDPTAGRGIPTGFKGLNAILNGFQPSDLILIAARPGQGKTSIGMNFIEHAAMHAERKTAAGKSDPYKCAVFSLEMPAIQLAKRMLCSEAGVDMSKANSGKLSPDDWRSIAAAKARLDKAHIYIDDSSLTTPIEILSKCRRLKREKGLDLVMVDYLQLMTSGDRVESRQQEISTITRTMKIAAKELNVPILLLSQMSREVEKRTNKRPQMSDLRESGAIEQDADIIMFIYREYDKDDPAVDEEKRNKVELVIAKHRNGETGNVELRWDGPTVRFLDVDKSRATASLEKNIPPERGVGFVGPDDEPPEPFSLSEKSAEEILSVPDSGDVNDIF